MKKVLLKIDGMTCSACSTGLEKYLNKQEGIKQATVNLIMNNANVEYDDKKLTLEQVEKFVEKIDDHPCYVCARMRRGYLYKKAQELGCTTLLCKRG